MCGVNSPLKFFLTDINPIVMKEPLADLLGAYQNHGAYMEYYLEDAIKLTGHICPAVASAWVACRKALGHLYLGDIPERGNIEVKVHGAADEKAFGVTAQVFGLVTGAAGSDGFKGIGDKFKRRGLLSFEKAEGDAESYTLTRQDNGSSVKVTIDRDKLPAVEGQDKIPALMAKVAEGSLSHEEEHELQDIWMERVKAIVAREENLDAWLTIEKA